MTESTRVEYKSALTDKLEREVVAFINYNEGGIIYVGIDDDGKVVGVDNADEAQLKIVDRIKNNILPNALGLFDVVLEKHDGKSVIKIIISSGRRSHITSSKKACRRAAVSCALAAPSSK